VERVYSTSGMEDVDGGRRSKGAWEKSVSCVYTYVTRYGSYEEDTTEFVKRFKIRLQGGRDGHCAPRKEESCGSLIKNSSVSL